MSQWRLIANADLQARNTFGVAARAPWLLEVVDASALGEVLALPQLRGAAPLLLGGGSNLLFAGDPQTAVIALDTHRIEILADDGDQALVRVDAGVEWHALVL
jgi:UDP-N-acetylmuramate dehydrogenase